MSDTVTAAGTAPAAAKPAMGVFERFLTFWVALGCVHEYWPTCADEYWPTLRGLICYGLAGRSRSASLLCLSFHVLLALRCAVVRRNR